MSDLLASATLVKLYVEQGHLGRAREVVKALLQRDPHHGHARAWEERLRVRTHAVVNCRLDAEGVVAARWQRVPGARRARLEVHVFEAGETEATVHRTTCERPGGTFEVARPVHGSALACIRAGAEPDARILAVSPQVTW